MGRDSHSATWRALVRMATVLVANVGTEITADAPSGISLDAPAAADIFLLPNVKAVRKHNANTTNHLVVYLFPSSKRAYIDRTTGPTGVSMPSSIEITIAVRITEEGGAAAFAEAGFKTLTSEEREFRRCESLLGAFEDAIRTKIRGPAVTGDDIVRAQFVSSDTDDDRFKRSDDPGTWCSQRWLIHQITNTPIQS